MCKLFTKIIEYTSLFKQYIIRDSHAQVSNDKLYHVHLSIGF